MLGFLGAVVGAIASHKAQKRAAAAQEAAYKRMLAEQAAARKRQAEIDAKNRELAKQDAANKFTDMNKAASKAGINPLTALRATGGAGFGAYGGYNGLMQSTIQAPVLSKQSFAMNLGTRLANTFIDMKMNAPIDRYNAEVRNLELEQRRLDIKLGKQQLDALRSVGVGIGSNKGNNPEATNSRTAVTTPAGTISPANVSDAEAYEQRYGDIVQEIAGIGTLLSDLYNTGLISAETAFGKKPSYNNPGRGEMVKRRLTTPIFSTPLGRTTPGFGEQWSMYAP
jgi:hypothetical protein